MELNPNFSEKANTDFYLVQSAIEGNEQAYSELLGRYKDSIYFMLLKMVNNSIDAEDLTIEAFSKAFKNIDQYSPNFAFSTWLYKIATNNCIDHLRKKRCNTISIDNESSNINIDANIFFKTNTLNPEEKIIQEQREKIVREIVNKLKPRYKRLIELRYFEELSYEEIATELEIPIGTVKAQLFRSKELLLNILQKSNNKF
jgi:RNA polymerase sigma-70 factor (ECF subfamily)